MKLITATRTMLLASLFFTFSCRTVIIGDLPGMLNYRILDSYDTDSDIEVFFGSNRKTDGEPGCKNSYFSTELGTETVTGTCTITVPARHEIGNIDSAPSEDNSPYFTIRDFKPFSKNRFYKKIKSDKFEEIIVFVHGFNVRFEDAVLRASQIKYDLKFPGKVVLYTWPAGSPADGLLGQIFIKQVYKQNFRNAISSRPVFREFLQELSEKTGKKIHLVVHSMGHQIALNSLAEIGNNNNQKIVEQLILNAPDYDVREFNSIKSYILKTSRRVTLYCSPGDNALLASSQVNASHRLGSCKKTQGVDVVNVNPIDQPLLGVGGLGHGYYSSRPVLTDVFQVILGIDVDKRLFIRKSSATGDEDFVLRK